MAGLSGLPPRFFFEGLGLFIRTNCGRAPGFWGLVTRDEHGPAEGHASHLASWFRALCAKILNEQEIKPHKVSFFFFFFFFVRLFFLLIEDLAQSALNQLAKAACNQAGPCSARVSEGHSRVVHNSCAG